MSSLGASAEYTLEPIQWAAHMPWKDDLFGMTTSEYAARFKKDYGYDPDLPPSAVVRSSEVYHRAIQKAGSIDPEKVRDAIATTDMMTAYGAIRFNDKGQKHRQADGRDSKSRKAATVVVYPKEYEEADFALSDSSALIGLRACFQSRLAIGRDGSPIFPFPGGDNWRR